MSAAWSCDRWGDATHIALEDDPNCSCSMCRVWRADRAAADRRKRKRR